MSETTLHLSAVNWKPTLRGLRDVQDFVTETKVLRSKGLKRFPKIEFGLADSLPAAIDSASKSPNTSIVLACGFPTGEIRDAVSQRGNETFLSILSSPPKGTEPYHRPTSSLFEQPRITRLESLREGARKAVLRFAAKSLGELREIVEPAEFESFFSLRYRVWKEMGYLSPEKGLDRDGWEIDHFDRLSNPIGLFSRDIAASRISGDPFERRGLRGSIDVDLCKQTHETHERCHGPLLLQISEVASPAISGQVQHKHYDHRNRKHYRSHMESVFRALPVEYKSIRFQDPDGRN